MTSAELSFSQPEESPTSIRRLDTNKTEVMHIPTEAPTLIHKTTNQHMVAPAIVSIQ